MKLSLINVYPAKDTIHKSLQVAVQYQYEVGREIILSLSGIIKDDKGSIIADLHENYQTRDTTTKELTAYELSSKENPVYKEYTSELTAKLDEVAINHIAKSLLRNKDEGLKLEIDLTCQYLSADLLLFNYRNSVFRSPTYIDFVTRNPGEQKVYHEYALLKDSEVFPSPFTFIKYSTEEIANWPFVMNSNEWGYFLLGQDSSNTL